MYPLSYFSIVLIILFVIDKKLASNFYPFIILSAVIGIIINLGLIFYIPFRNFFYRIFPLSISLHIPIVKNNLLIYYLITILFKILLIIYWPINISVKSLLISLTIPIIYICSIKLYRNYK